MFHDRFYGTLNEIWIFHCKRSTLCQFLILITHRRTKRFLNVPIKSFIPTARKVLRSILSWSLDNKSGMLVHHSNGIFTNPIRRTSFEFKGEEGTVSEDILEIDARFVSLLKWLGENHINVRLSGAVKGDKYAVYKIREIAFGGGVKLSAEDGFLQFMIERLLASDAPSQEIRMKTKKKQGTA